MTYRVDNFSAGPATLPLSVLQDAQKELLNFQNSGMSIMEMSHRGAIFEPIHQATIALARRLLFVPDDFVVLFLSGGASTQFAMTAMNLLNKNNCAALINSGVWAGKALAEAQKIGTMHEIWSGKNSNFNTLPNEDSLVIPENSRYLHITSNETINGLQWRQFPNLGVPLVIDASSDFFSRNISWDQCDIVYGGVQKNLAPAGLTLVFVRKNALPNNEHLPKMFNYQTHISANSLYNTPATWQIYLLGKVLKWITDNGGVAEFARRADERSRILYQAIDDSDFYINDVALPYRSKMNVVFRTPTAELDTQFWQQADKNGLSGLKGHRAVGGIRASMYNAMDIESVERLIDFMQKFAKQNK